VNVVRDVVGGILAVSQANGMGAMTSNTLLFGWPNDSDRLADLLRTLQRLEAIHKSVLIADVHPRAIYPKEGVPRTIHVWWGGLQRNGDLMLLLAYLMTRNPEWRGAKVQVMGVASNDHAREETERQLAKLIPEIRIDAEIEVIVKAKESTIREIIHSRSREADIVFLGLAVPEEGQEQAYAARLVELSEGLGTVIFVRNASVFVGELV